MAVQKVEYGGTTLIDLTADTATAADVLQGKTFHKADGTIATGSIAKLAAQTFTPTTADQTIAAGKYLDGAQTIKGDANLVASNIASGVSIFGVVGTFAGGGGGTSLFEGIVMRSFASSAIIENAAITTVGDYAFYRCSKLQAVSFPNVSEVQNMGFGWTFIKTANLPSCLTLRSSAFYRCSTLTTIVAPLCASIYGSAFYWCSSLSNISFPNCDFIGGSETFNDTALRYASFPACTGLYGTSNFRSCIYLKEASFPLMSLSIGAYNFANCGNLTTVYFPIASNMGTSVFMSCSRLTDVTLTSCKGMGQSAFYGCYSLSTLSLPNMGNIANNGFAKCYNLLSLYLMGSSVCKLNSVNAFSSTPISNYTTSTGGVYGSIFVPASLYSAYISSTNWVTYSARIVSV